MWGRLTLALGVSASSGINNGIAKVVQMLKAMHEESKKEGQAEEISYGKFSQWCDDTTSELTTKISEAEDEDLPTQNAKMQSGQEKAASLEEEINVADGKITNIEQEMDNEKERRAKDNKVHLKVKADYDSSISAVQKAIKALKTNLGKSLVQIGEEQMSTAERDMVIGLLELSEESAKKTGDASNQIIAMLKDLKDKFVEELNAELTKENKKAAASTLAVQALQGQLDDLNGQKKRDTGAMQRNRQSAAEAESAIADLNKMLKANKETLQQTQGDCSMRKREHEEAVQTRVEEQAAITKAIEIVAGIDTKSSLVQTSSLIQISRVVDSAQDKLDAAKTVLLQAAADQSNGQLRLVAMQMGGPIDKVMKMIKELIVRMKEQGIKEAEKHGKCSLWKAENREAIDSAQEEVTSLTAQVKDKTSKMTKNTNTLKANHKAEMESKKQVKEAQAMRQDESAENKVIIADAKAGAEACAKAIEVLQEFYDSKGGNRAGAGGGIVGMLEAVQMDFLKLRQDTEASEAANQKAFVSLRDSEQVASEERQAESNHLKEQNAGLQQEIADRSGDLQNQSEILKNAKKQTKIIDVDKKCNVNAGKTRDQIYKEKVQAREAEMASLKQAYDLLS